MVIDAHVDPEVPPLPPHISLEQARAYTMSILKGDPNRVQAVTQSIKELASTFMPGRDKKE